VALTPLASCLLDRGTKNLPGPSFPYNLGYLSIKKGYNIKDTEKAHPVNKDLYQFSIKMSHHV
jgi:hypothetical protein